MKTIFAVYATSDNPAYAPDGLHILQTSIVGEGALVGVVVGNPPIPGKKTWQVKMSVTDVTATPDYLALGTMVSKQWGGEGPQMGGRDFQGDMAEVLVYRGALTPLQQFQVQAYLKAKYKLGS